MRRGQEIIYSLQGFLKNWNVDAGSKAYNQLNIAMNELENQLYEHLSFLYGEALASSLTRRLVVKLVDFKTWHPELSSANRETYLSEQDVILITYGDMVQSRDSSHLRTLAGFLNRHAADSINTVHILPFYPYSSDDGYAVIDYRKVNPELGSWDDIQLIGERFNIMFDGVFNHVSARGDWFQGFLRDDPVYRQYFITVEPGTDLSCVFRPRATPPYTPVLTPSGEKLVWTTYSADQIDLNYKNPKVLFEIIDTLFLYVSQGMDIIRLDGAAYLWKQVGTSCTNLPQTHTIVQLLRVILDEVAPQVNIFTQTNVPHPENIQYFGDGRNEAQLIYNFALPFMVLHAFHKGVAGALIDWVNDVDWPASGQTAYFNFLAGHDGIGMLPVYDILPENEIEFVVERVRAMGGDVSEKVNEDGSLMPYELNVNYLDALSNPNTPNEDTELVAERFLAAQAILLSLPGVPGVYFHSLVGSRGWADGVRQSGQARTINREKLDFEQLEEDLVDPDSLRSLVFHGFLKLLKIRAASPAFHPAGIARFFDIHPRLFSVVRVSTDGLSTVLCLINISNKPLNIRLDLESLDISTVRYVDMISGRQYEPISQLLEVDIEPYKVIWLRLSD